MTGHCSKCGQTGGCDCNKLVVTETMLDDASPEQIDRANAAVGQCLGYDGEPIWDSAQGYACALTAIIQTDLASRIDCETCDLPTNGTGYFGAMCQCERAPVLGPAVGHGAGVGPVK